MNDAFQTAKSHATAKDTDEPRRAGGCMCVHCFNDANNATSMAATANARSKQQAMQELRKAVAFHDQIAASVRGGEGTTAIAASQFAQKWLLQAAKRVVIDVAERVPQRRMDL